MANEAHIIGRVTRIGQLYDLYGSLLTERQRQMIELHFIEDLSLSEISEHFSVSRQAIHDNLRRAEEQMEGYERALHLLSTQIAADECVRRLTTIWDDVKFTMPMPERQRMDEALAALLPDVSVLTTGRDEDA